MRGQLQNGAFLAIRRHTHPLRALIVCLLLNAVLLVTVGTASGQTDSSTHSDLAAAWGETADAAVSALADEATSTDAFDRLRARLSAQRTEALDAQSKLKSRVETLEAELNALGPAPAEGEEEPVEIAELRAQLNERIATARVPFLEAQAAYERADGLIGEIDVLVRARLSQQLTNLEPTPVNPNNWPAAFTAIAGFSDSIREGYQNIWNSSFKRSSFIGGLPFAAILIMFGLIVHFYGRRRVIALMHEGFDEDDGQLSNLHKLGLSAVRLLLPSLTAMAIILGVSQLLPDIKESDALVSGLSFAAIALIVAYWVGNALFSPDLPEAAVLHLEPRPAYRARRMALALGIILALMLILRAIAEASGFEPRARAVLFLPLFLLGSLCLARLSKLLRHREVVESEVDQEEAPMRVPTTNALRDLIGRAGLVIALIVPVLALVGYLSAARALFIPAVETLGLLGVLVVIYARMRDFIDGWLEADGDARRQSDRRRYRSAPVVVGLALICMAGPFLALIWGARPSDLQEVWVWLRDGVAIGDVRLSVTDLLTFILVFAVGYTITRMLQAVTRGSVLPRFEIDRGASNAIVSGIGYVGIFLAAVLAISATGLSLGNLAIVAGALSVGIGFGLQTIVSNFVSGIILLVERPIKEGDWIEVAGYSGNVRKISVRSTQIDTFDGAAVIVPNAELIAGTVLNWTHTEMTGRVIVPVGVAYGSDARKVEEVLLEVARAHPMVLRRPAPSVVFQGFGADSMDFEIRAFLRDVTWMLSAKSDLNFAIVQKFEEVGIEIPYAQRDINLRNVDEAAKAFWAGKKGAER